MSTTEAAAVDRPAAHTPVADKPVADKPVADKPAADKPAAATLDDMMLAMDVVDTLRHRERLVERELDEEEREDQLIERLRALYKGQGIEVPDSILAEGVKALKESRFVYTPPKRSFARTMATLWVRRSSYGKWLGAGLAALVVVVALYHFGVVRPRQQAVEAARIELSDTLPRQLAAAHQAVTAESRVPDARQRADAILAQGRAALDRGNAADARAATADLDRLALALRQEYVLRIAGRPEDRTGFFREHPRFQGRAYFVVVDAIVRPASRFSCRSTTTRLTGPTPFRASPCVCRSRRSRRCETTRPGMASCRMHAWPRNVAASSSPNSGCLRSKTASLAGEDGRSC
jgi:Family of unknown function (DUF6384)